MLRRAVILTLATLLFACGGDETNNSTGNNSVTDAGSDAANNQATDVGTADGGIDMSTGPATGLQELIYDDDIIDLAWVPASADGFVTGAIVAQFFEPPADGTLNSARIIITNFGNPTGALEVEVYGADNGEPGDELLDEPLLVQADRRPAFPSEVSPTWIDVDLSEFDIPVTSEGFYIGVRFVAATASNSPGVGLDLNTPQTRDRARVYTPQDGWGTFLDAVPDEIESTPMIRATVELAEADLDPTVMLSNYSKDCSAFQAGILPDGLQEQWSATRLEPPSTPFAVESIRYVLRTGPNDAPFPDCDATLEHRVRVFVGGASPDASPEPVREFTTNLEQTDVITEYLPVRIDLDEPLVVNEGEFLYIAVEMPGTGPQLCVGICGDSYELDENWLSGSLETPFTWTNFDVLGEDVGVTHRAYGKPVE